MRNIDWLPISELPDALKDGRECLIWIWGAPHTASIDRNYDLKNLGWWVGDVYTREQPSHFAEINPPT